MQDTRSSNLEGSIVQQSLRLLASGLTAAFLFAGHPAQAAEGDPIAGETLAKQWCAACHDTGHGETVKDGAPSFLEVARHPDFSRDRLKAWLSDPHPPMPKLDLSRRAIDDLISYIGSLK